MLTQKEYRDKGGAICPKCSTVVCPAPLEIINDSTVAHAEAWCYCHNCCAEWTETFVLKGYSDFKIDK